MFILVLVAVFAIQTVVFTVILSVEYGGKILQRDEIWSPNEINKSTQGQVK